MSEYDFGISYIKGKENVVVDSLSIIPHIFSLVPSKVYLREQVLGKLLRDSCCLNVTLCLQSGRKLESKFEGYSLEVDGLLRYQVRMYIPMGGDIQSIIIKESHRALYCAHLGVEIMYENMKKILFWADMKRDVVHFVIKCLGCQQVKVDHHHLSGLLQLHDVPMSKSEVISMDFIVVFPLTSQRNKVILVIVEKLTKNTHFILVIDAYDVTDVACVLISEVIYLLGLPKNIISNMDSRFTYRIWTSLQSTIGTYLNLNTTYHPETYGKNERVN
jgi:hypothetical protein